MVRIGFVGTGGRAIDEMLQLIRVPEAEIAALCDIAPERCGEAQDRVNRALAEAGRPAISVPVFAEAPAMLGSVGLDAVYVSLPPFAHGPAEHAILGAGRAMLVEKPVALDPGLGREILAHAREAGVVTCAGYQLRYSAAIQRARALLAGRPVGMAIATRFGGMPGAPWWQRQDRSGGMLIEMHTHAVDLLRYLVGEVETAYAQADRLLLTDRPEMDIADCSAATLRFACGAVGVVANSCALEGGLRLPGAGGTHILARGMSLTLGGGQPAASFEGGRVEALPEAGDPDARLNEAFVRAVATGDRTPVLSDYADGLRTFEVTYACHRSAVLGRPLRVGEAE